MKTLSFSGEAVYSTPRHKLPNFALEKLDMGKKQATQAYVVCFSVTSEMITCGIGVRIQVIINIGKKHCKLSEKKYIYWKCYFLKNNDREVILPTSEYLFFYFTLFVNLSIFVVGWRPCLSSGQNMHQILFFYIQPINKKSKIHFSYKISDFIGMGMRGEENSFYLNYVCA